MGDEERRQRRREYQRRYLERHPERRKASLKNYNNKPETKARIAEWIENHRDQYATSKRNWQDRNPEYCKEFIKRYRQKNPGWMPAQCAKRRAKKLNATPSWLSEEDHWWIEEIYELASLRTRMTGIKWVVDHIVPLQGRKVCGLHVPQNLQVITESENSKKGNKFVS